MAAQQNKDNSKDNDGVKALNILISVATAIILAVGGWLGSTVNALNLEVTALRENVKGLNERLTQYDQHSVKLDALGNRLTKIETRVDIDNTRSNTN